MANAGGGGGRENRSFFFAIIVGPIFELAPISALWVQVSKLSSRQPILPPPGCSGCWSSVVGLSLESTSPGPVLAAIANCHF